MSYILFALHVCILHNCIHFNKAIAWILFSASGMPSVLQTEALLRGFGMLSFFVELLQNASNIMFALKQNGLQGESTAAE